MQKPLKTFATLFAAFSLVSLTACDNGPKVTVCISRPESGGFICMPHDSDTSFLLPFAESDKYVAFSPDDARTLLTYCGLKTKEATALLEHFYSNALRYKIESWRMTSTESLASSRNSEKPLSSSSRASMNGLIQPTTR